MRPSAIVTRLRDAIPEFQGRVAGAAGVEDAMDLLDRGHSGLPVPCAYVLWAGEEASADITLSAPDLIGVAPPQQSGGLDAEVEIAFNILVLVDGRGDDTGLDASERLLDIRDAMLATLRGWTPDRTRYGALIYDGAPDPPAYNRAYGAAVFAFRGSYLTSAP